MYLNLSCEATIQQPDSNEKLVIPSIEYCGITTSWQMLTDTARVTLARLYSVDSQLIDIRDRLKKGTRISIAMGYNGELVPEFSGYITGFEGTGPLTVHCEDEMWRLKAGSLSREFKGENLQRVVSFIAPDHEQQVLDVNIGDLAIHNVSPAKALDELRENYRLYSYFPANSQQLRVGFAYRFEDYSNHIIHLQENTKDNDLHWENIEKGDVQVKAISNSQDGTLLVASYPDEVSNPSVTTLNFANIGSVADLKQIAKGHYEKMAIEGYRGTVTLFGIPSVRHGDTVEIRDARFPERNGSYFVDTIQKVFNSRSAFYKQVLNIGLKA